MTTAKELLLAAGWTVINKVNGSIFMSNGGERLRFLSPMDAPDDNLCDMLIRELSEEQMDFFEDILSGVVGSIFQNCTYGASLLRATPEQKAAALMETYKERE